MSKIIYWTKESKFETYNWYDIPWSKLHSPNEQTPALIYPSDNKEWFFEGKLHRLTGPASIWGNFENEFRLNGIYYEFENWLKNHPNQNIGFQTKMRLQYT